MKRYLLVTLLAANSIMVQTSDFSGLNTNGKKFDNLNGRCSALEKFQADSAPHIQTLADLNLAEQFERIDSKLQAATTFLTADEPTDVDGTEPTQPRTLNGILQLLARSQTQTKALAERLAQIEALERPLSDTANALDQANLPAHSAHLSPDTVEALTHFFSGPAVISRPPSPNPSDELNQGRARSLLDPSTLAGMQEQIRMLWGSILRPAAQDDAETLHGITKETRDALLLLLHGSASIQRSTTPVDPDTDETSSQDPNFVDYNTLSGLCEAIHQISDPIIKLQQAGENHEGRITALEASIKGHLAAVEQHHAKHEKLHHDHAALADTTDLTEFRTQLTKLEEQIDAFTTASQDQLKRLTLDGEKDLATRLREVQTEINSLKISTAAVTPENIEKLQALLKDPIAKKLNELQPQKKSMSRRALAVLTSPYTVNAAALTVFVYGLKTDRFGLRRWLLPDYGKRPF